MLITALALVRHSKVEQLLLLLQYCDFVKITNYWAMKCDWTLEKEIQFYVVNPLPLECFSSLHPKSVVICHQLLKILLCFNWLDIWLIFMEFCVSKYFIIFSIDQFVQTLWERTRHCLEKLNVCAAYLNQAYTSCESDVHKSVLCSTIWNHKKLITTQIVSIQEN